MHAESPVNVCIHVWVFPCVIFSPRDSVLLTPQLFQLEEAAHKPWVHLGCVCVCHSLTHVVSLSVTLGLITLDICPMLWLAAPPLARTLTYRSILALKWLIYVTCTMLLFFKTGQTITCSLQHWHGTMLSTIGNKQTSEVKSVVHFKGMAAFRWVVLGA